ncbi:hypothetical protein M9434_001410 [Picochlorum sp. BPE23]|nr:hypothetical protein M9434_001410 [Picochlorum sp. BPE23]KAI8110130.1 hypothetical protein M9435_001809 [Picochlorum sp. BPE23]
MLFPSAHCRVTTELRVVSCGSHSTLAKQTTFQTRRSRSRPSFGIKYNNDIIKNNVPRIQHVYASAPDEEGDSSTTAGDGTSLKSDKDLAAEEAERLRAAEKFMVIGTGEAECKGCGYTYKPGNGDPEYPIAKGTKFNELPDDWNCPVCGAEKKMFVSTQKEIAGFAENQGYGLGTNSMTGEQKSLLIFGSLAAFFALFLLGYAMN